MDFFKNSLEQIRRLMGSLTLGARVAMGLLAVMVVAALAAIISWGGKPQMTPIWATPLAAEELGHASSVLRREGIAVQVRDGLLHVPADQRDAAAGSLYYENILPADSVTAFEQLAREESMWRTEKQDERIWQQVKQAVLSRLISKFPGVRSATVIVEPGTPQGLGRPSTPPTASVHITLMRDGVMSSKLRASVADLVAGSVTRMKREDVRIVDATNGRSYRVTEEVDGGSDRLERMTALESYYSSKLLSHFGYIPGVIVSVHAVPDPMQQQRRVDEEYREPVSGVTDAVSESTSGGMGVGGEPGTTANVGGLDIVKLGGRTATHESSSESLSVRFPHTLTETLITGTAVKEISASINVPRDYLVNLHQKLTGNTDQPQEADFAPHLQRIQEQVMPLIGVRQPELVKVDWYFTEANVPAAAPAQAGVSGTIFQYGKPAAVAGLSLVALVMVMSFVRRRNYTRPAVEVNNPLGGLLDASVGVAGSEDGALTAVELDDDTVRSQRIVEQVAQMVKKNPDSAANLVKRWITQK